MQTEVVT